MANNKNDDPSIIRDCDLDEVSGALKLGDIEGMKVTNEFKTFTDLSTTDSGVLKGDKEDVLIQNIGFPDDGGGGSGKL